MEVFTISSFKINFKVILENDFLEQNNFTIIKNEIIYVFSQL